MLTRDQRIAWAEYFKLKKINYVFFSAAKANELLEKEREELENIQNSTGSSSSSSRNTNNNTAAAAVGGPILAALALLL